jgi:uncharacterized protein
MLWPMVALWADPWNPEFGMGFEPPLEEATSHRADPFVETEDWSRSIVAAPQVKPTPVWFVDGVRRVELRVLADEGDRRMPGLFGSFAVGAVHCDGKAAFGEHRVGRALILGGGMMPDGVKVPCGRAELEFQPVADPSPDPNGQIERLQRLMRDAEDAIAAMLVLGGASLVLADGPLRLGHDGGLPVVGVVKRFVRRYLEPVHEALLARLGPGERTPIFALIDQDGAVRGYSWYTRLVTLKRPWHDRAGIVRCEVRAMLGPDQARNMADSVTGILPGYAGRPTDPRAPQNLAPVGGLESWLRHRMGDHAMIRRTLVAWLAGKE